MKRKKGKKFNVENHNYESRIAKNRKFDVFQKGSKSSLDLSKYDEMSESSERIDTLQEGSQNGLIIDNIMNTERSKVSHFRKNNRKKHSNQVLPLGRFLHNEIEKKVPGVGRNEDEKSQGPVRHLKNLNTKFHKNNSGDINYRGKMTQKGYSSDSSIESSEINDNQSTRMNMIKKKLTIQTIKPAENNDQKSYTSDSF